MAHTNRSRPSRDANSAPFDAPFFRSLLPEHVRVLHATYPGKVPVVLLQLADDTCLDLCHIETLDPRWMAVSVYRDRRTCAEMDTIFVPYPAITRVILTPEDPGAQPQGFQLEKSLAASAG
ncbi:MAG: hypothetical protein HYY16_09950 [Planctomycetes bacterium]|nr:hypothetical protein [Planctomycetota bacterium]